MNPEKRLGRLKPEFLDECRQAPGGLPKRTRFFQWLRSHPQENRRARFSEHHWKPLQESEPIPWELVEGFVRFAETRILQRSIDPTEVAEPVEEGYEGSGHTPQRDWWNLSNSELFRLMLQPFAISEAAQCHTREDVEWTARLSIETVGRHLLLARGQKPTDDQCLAAGQAEMQVTLKDYKERLLALWKRDPRTIVFATVSDQRLEGGTRRVGAGVVLPVREEAYQRFRRGEIDYLDFRETDVESPSPFLYLEMVAEVSSAVFRNRSRRSMAQLHALAYQLASHAPDLNGPGPRPVPRVIALAGTPEMERRARNYGYLEAGARTPRTGKPVIEVGPVGEGSRQVLGTARLAARAQYEAMCGLFRVYQFAMTTVSERTPRA